MLRNFFYGYVSLIANISSLPIVYLNPFHPLRLSQVVTRRRVAGNVLSLLEKCLMCICCGCTVWLIGITSLLAIARPQFSSRYLRKFLNSFGVETVQVTFGNTLHRIPQALEEYFMKLSL